MTAKSTPKIIHEVLADSTVMAIAREIAIDHYPLSEILNRWNVSQIQWETIAALPAFQEYLVQEKAAWKAATNTPARIKLKSAALVEFYLTEASARLHDPSEPLNHKVSLLTQISKFAGLETKVDEVAQIGDRVTININIGPQQPSIQINSHMIDVTPEVTTEAEEDQPTDFDWDQEFGEEIPAINFEEAA